MAILVQNTLPSAVRTITGSVDLGAIPAEFTEAVFYIDVTAFSGTAPTLVVAYQSSPNETMYFDHTAGASLMAVGRQVIRITNTIGRYGRLTFTLGGTGPSFTFSVTSEFKRP